MRNVNEVMADRLTAAGLAEPADGHPAHAAVAAIASAVDAVLPTAAADPLTLRLVAEALRSYADVAEEYAGAMEKGAPAS